MKNEEAVAMVEKHVRILSEHFDTVQIFITHHDPTKENYGTINLTCGNGNWFARYGHIKDFLNRVEETARHEKRKSMDNE